MGYLAYLKVLSPTPAVYHCILSISGRPVPPGGQLGVAACEELAPGAEARAVKLSFYTGRSHPRNLSR